MIWVNKWKNRKNCLLNRVKEEGFRIASPLVIVFRGISLHEKSRNDRISAFPYHVASYSNCMHTCSGLRPKFQLKIIHYSHDNVSYRVPQQPFLQLTSSFLKFYLFFLGCRLPRHPIASVYFPFRLIRALDAEPAPDFYVFYDMSNWKLFNVLSQIQLGGRLS